jgi:lysophospholipase L1-like esterase
VKEYIPSFLAHDFAIAGVFAHQMKYEIDSQFLPYAGSRPDWAPWESDEALFGTKYLKSLLISVTWVGINDMGVGFDAQSQLSTLFKLQESLYNVDARHFLFFNVPPTDRSPAALEGITTSLAPDSNDVGPGGHQRNERLNSNIVGWNTKLAEHVKTFKMKHPDITIGIYDAHALFTKVLDNPQEYGFQDAYSSGDSDKYIWKDQLHPTSAMHKVIAADVAKFLTEFEGVIDK